MHCKWVLWVVEYLRWQEKETPGLREKAGRLKVSYLLTNLAEANVHHYGRISKFSVKL